MQKELEVLRGRSKGRVWVEWIDFCAPNRCWPTDEGTGWDSVPKATNDSVDISPNADPGEQFTPSDAPRDADLERTSPAQKEDREHWEVPPGALGADEQWRDAVLGVQQAGALQPTTQFGEPNFEETKLTFS